MPHQQEAPDSLLRFQNETETENDHPVIVDQPTASGQIVIQNILPTVTTKGYYHI